MEKFKLNIHAHTIFSDGSASPLGMALAAKEVGLTSLVITDHFYVSDQDFWCSINPEKLRLLRKAAKEASKIIPTIVGIELAFGNEEILTFGTDTINAIIQHTLNKGELTLELLLKWKNRYDSAFVLCHPGDPKNWKTLFPLLDGYEEYNSGSSMFKNGRDRGVLSDLPGWCNSDAHSVKAFDRAYNIVDTKIENEADLIAYIRSGKTPVHYCKHVEQEFNNELTLNWDELEQ